MKETCVVEMVISSRERDLGGFSVRRILPYVSRRMVGPFVFFDHMGPAEFAPGQGMDVRPHPHVGLATVTYLFEGRIHHRDSLGSDQVIEPGAVNWMTAGRGIVHSERTRPEDRARGARLNGIQLWVALPERDEETTPTFTHHPSASLPEFEVDGARVKLLLGTLFERVSPVRVHSELFYAELRTEKGARLRLPIDGREAALYVVSGAVTVADQALKAHEMAILSAGRTAEIKTDDDARVMLIGGAPVGERFLYWNFVSSSKGRLDEAKRAWAPGPSAQSTRFKPVPGDEREFIPLPKEPGQPKGTPL